tara:strand:+ start:1948 stop:2058 length:111 start_codon:yes stop_codon:yes gene_type:complete
MKDEAEKPGKMLLHEYTFVFGVFRFARFPVAVIAVR